MTEVETDPFEAFDNAAGIFAFCHMRFGDDGLRELLAGIDVDREALERDAAELETMGLPKVAAIVAEFAADAPSALARCPYVPSDRCNYENWMTSHQRQHGRRP